MRKKVGTGIWLIFFGITILLHNIGVIHFNFYALLDYWPLLIIAVGINIILQNKKHGDILSAIAHIGICISLLYIGLTSKSSPKLDILYRFGNIQDTIGLQESVTVPFYPAIREASLTFDIGAATLVIDSVSSGSLLQASSSQGNAGLKIESDTSSRTYPKIALVGVAQKDTNPAKAPIHLSVHTDPIWNMAFNMGAASFTGNLSAYKFSKLSINSGATSIDLRLGMPQMESTVIEINTAASTCKITLPREAACLIEPESVLSSKEMDDFSKEGKHYKTENYETAVHKYIIKISGAANAISIYRI